MMPWAAAPKSPGNQFAQALNTSFNSALPRNGGPPLSPVEQRVSVIANQNGDRDYLMVDKVQGKLILFQEGKPIFTRAALTGKSLADRIRPDAWNTPWARQGSVEYKVTPAGRFTMTRDHDPSLGDLFDVNELKGKDWTIAIHQVWLGRPSERRDARLRSDQDQDKHITDGCVDVDPGTIAQLWRLLPGRGMALYILPIDENLIEEIFQPAVKRANTRS